MNTYSFFGQTAVWLFGMLVTALCASMSKPALASAVAPTLAAVTATTVNPATVEPATVGRQMLSPARCARLALDLQHVRDQFRRGYSIRQQVQLEQKQDRLRLALQNQCQPLSQTGLQSRPASRTAAPAKPHSHHAKPLQISVVSLTAPYQGKQLQAWLAFYQSPFYCYNVRATERIRQCVEQRQAAQRRFERRWRQQNLSDQ